MESRQPDLDGTTHADRILVSMCEHGSLASRLLIQLTKKVNALLS
jgi:hypothetical protein